MQQRDKGWWRSGTSSCWPHSLPWLHTLWMCTLPASQREEKLYKTASSRNTRISGNSVPEKQCNSAPRDVLVVTKLLPAGELQPGPQSALAEKRAASHAHTKGSWCWCHLLVHRWGSLIKRQEMLLSFAFYSLQCHSAYFKNRCHSKDLYLMFCLSQREGAAEQRETLGMKREGGLSRDECIWN